MRSSQELAALRERAVELRRKGLRIDVRHGAELYRKIEGWATASMTDVTAPAMH